MAKNKEAIWSVANVTLRLLVICLVVAALVALVFTVTEEPIANGERARKAEAIRSIFAEGVEPFAEDESIVAEGVSTVFAVKNAAGEHIGWCVDYVGNSDYGGDVNMMIGVGIDGRCCGLQVISHGETFMDRYVDENGRYTGADLSAGATMSYNAIRSAIAAVEALLAPLVSSGNVTEEETQSETALSFDLEDVSLFFEDVADFSQPESCSNQHVSAVRLVKDTEGKLLGRCVQYTVPNGYCGEIHLLMGVSLEGAVIGTRVMKCHELERIGGYLDQSQCFDLSQDAVASATTTYNAITNAIAAVEALQLGGAA